VRQKKPAVVYFAPKKAFQKCPLLAHDIDNLLRKCDRASVERLARELGIEHARPRAILG
jgi:hypothetical protein